MGFYDAGNPPITSTQGITTNPSTTTLCAELDSTELGTANYRAGQSGLFRVTWIIGGDTSATWQLEQAASTALNDSTRTIWVKTPTGQSGQFITNHRLEQNHRLRARINSSFTAAVVASIQAESIT